MLQLEHLLKRLKEEVRKLPRGSISEKDRNGEKYYYWASRENEIKELEKLIRGSGR